MTKAEHDDESPATDRDCEAILKIGERAGQTCPAKKKKGHPYCGRHMKELGAVVKAVTTPTVDEVKPVQDHHFDEVPEPEATPKSITLAKLFDKRSALYRDLQQVETAILVVQAL